MHATVETELLIISPFIFGAVMFAKSREELIKPNLLQF